MLSRLMLNVRESDIIDRTHTTGGPLSDDSTLEDPSISFEMTTAAISFGQTQTTSDWSGSTQVVPPLPPLPPLPPVPSSSTSQPQAV